MRIKHTANTPVAYEMKPMLSFLNTMSDVVEIL